MDANVIAAGVSGFGALVTVSGGTFAAIRSGRDKRDRAADRNVAEETAEKLESEKEDIVDQTRSRLLKDIREELARTKAEAEEHRKAAEKYRREAYDLRDVLAEEKAASAKTIRELTEKAEVLMRRAATLETWIDDNRQQFKRLGIAGLPPDHRDDRAHHEEELSS